MATTNRSLSRPLSPHLQIYRPQLTSILSIVHRGTGVLLAVGTPLLIYWFWAVAEGGESFAAAQGFFGSWFGQLILFGWSFALFYHLCNGLRHLYWDIGKGYDLETLYKTGYAVLIGSGALTVLTWIVAIASRGSA